MTRSGGTAGGTGATDLGGPPYAVRAAWRNTTHDCAATVDHAHLELIRRAPARTPPAASGT